MVKILIKREVKNNKYFLVARDVSKSERGKVVAKTPWNQKVKEEFRERIKEKDVYREYLFKKDVKVNKVGLNREITREIPRGKIRAGKFQYVGIAVSKDGRKFYGRSGVVSSNDSNVVKRLRREEAKERTLRALAGVILNDSDAGDKEVFDAVKMFRIKIVYYDNQAFN